MMMEKVSVNFRVLLKVSFWKYLFSFDKSSNLDNSYRSVV